MHLFNEIKRFLTTPVTADGFFVRGQSYFDKGNYPAAIADFNDALKMGFSPDFRFYGARGIALFKNKQTGDAIKDLNKVIQQNPALIAARHVRGCAYQGEGNYDAAIADFTEVIKQRQDDFAAYVQRGRAYFCKGEYDSALSDFNSVMIAFPLC